MTESLVTIVIPTRNRLKYLQEAVESVRRQTHRSWQLVVVDDASEDETWKWLQTLGDPRIQTLRQSKHRERSAARNRGLAEARGEYVVFLDDDDRFMPGAIARLVRAIERYPGAALVAGARTAFDGFGHHARVSHPRIPFVRPEPWRDVLIGWVPGQGQTLIRTASLREAGGWNEGLAATEDQELLLRLGTLGTCVIAPCVALENRIHAGRWRHHDIASTEEQIRRDFVRRLAGRRRRLGERLLVARSLLMEAREAYKGRRFLQAGQLLKRVARTAPEIFWSPLVGPGLLSLWLKVVVGVVVGGRLFAGARAIRRIVRRARGSELVGTARVYALSARIKR